MSMLTLTRLAMALNLRMAIDLAELIDAESRKAKLDGKPED